ncbi:MAG: choline dehydrogenase [Bacteroidota bacterium]
MYDFILVGAGSAGCVLAARLTEDPHVRVLLLEAGGPDTAAAIHIPAAFSKLFKTEHDWDYSTEPQAHAAERAWYWPRGKVLGGSSSINAMIYIRGHRDDYDRWAASGAEGWDFASVLPYFKKAEDQARGADAYHGAGGPLRVEDQQAHNVLTEAFVTACVQAGIPANDDFNGPEQEGAGFYQTTTKAGRRWSAADAYLKPAMRRANLTVHTGAQVSQVLIDNGRATGVEYIMDGHLHRVQADREVILAGGAINSPQLLLLSGVGDADALLALGIPALHDLPGVGRHLQDHPVAGVRYHCKRPVSMMKAESPANVARYLVNRTGMLASNVAEAGAFIRTRATEDQPDIQYHFGPVDFADHGLTPPSAHKFSIGPTLVRPHSRGRLTLRSDDPFAKPAIDPNYFADPRDLASLVEGVRVARTIAAQKAFDRFRGSETDPGASMTSDEDLRRYVRETAETLYHPTSTCRIGPASAAERGDAVVDAECRVHGVDGLRVVDASVMPDVPGGNTHAPTVMIAERVADLIRYGEAREQAARVSGDGMMAEPTVRLAKR